MKIMGFNASRLLKLLLSIFLICLFAISCSKYDWENGRYYDKARKISMQFPAGWTVLQRESDKISFQNSDNTALIYILAGDMPSITLDEFIDRAIKMGAALHISSNYSAEKNELAIDGVKTYRYTTKQVTNSNGQFSFVSYYLIKSDVMYEIKIVAKFDYFEANEDELMKIAEGLRVES